jgi:hypothetical protein
VVFFKLEKCGYFELMESKKFNIFHEDINKFYKEGINVFWNSIFVTLGLCFLGAINT